MVHAQHPPVHPVEPVDAKTGWQLLLELAARIRAGTSPSGRAGFVLRAGRWHELVSHYPVPLLLEPHVWLDASHARLEQVVGFGPDAIALFELFIPLLVGPLAQRALVGHLGQSLDGRVATPTGASQFITGREDLVHTHRLRALFDAVVVGVRTVELDDPQLTTRLVSGAHPTRVVLDPGAKLSGGRFRLLEDRAAPTLIVCAEQALPHPRSRGPAEWLSVPCVGGRFDLPALLKRLRQRGLARVFVEGGGVTVSSFLSAGLLDRLHVSVAPLILGSGAPAFALPPIDQLDEAISLRFRHHALGRDVLFDCELVKKPAHAV